MITKISCFITSEKSYAVNSILTLENSQVNKKSLFLFYLIYFGGFRHFEIPLGVILS